MRRKQNRLYGKYRLQHGAQANLAGAAVSLALFAIAVRAMQKQTSNNTINDVFAQRAFTQNKPGTNLIVWACWKILPRDKSCVLWLEWAGPEKDVPASDVLMKRIRDAVLYESRRTAQVVVCTGELPEPDPNITVRAHSRQDGTIMKAPATLKDAWCVFAFQQRASRQVPLNKCIITYAAIPHITWEAANTEYTRFMKEA